MRIQMNLPVCRSTIPSGRSTTAEAPPLQQTVSSDSSTVRLKTTRSAPTSPTTTFAAGSHLTCTSAISHRISCFTS